MVQLVPLVTSRETEDKEDGELKEMPREPEVIAGRCLATASGLSLLTAGGGAAGELAITPQAPSDPSPSPHTVQPPAPPPTRAGQPPPVPMATRSRVGPSIPATAQSIWPPAHPSWAARGLLSGGPGCSLGVTVASQRPEPRATAPGARTSPYHRNN